MRAKTGAGRILEADKDEIARLMLPLLLRGDRPAGGGERDSCAAIAGATRG